MLSRESANINFIVFGLTRSGLEPTIYRTRGEHSNHYTTYAVVCVIVFQILRAIHCYLLFVEPLILFFLNILLSNIDLPINVTKLFSPNLEHRQFILKRKENYFSICNQVNNSTIFIMNKFRILQPIL